MTAINQMIKELEEVIARKTKSKEKADEYKICLRRAKELKEDECNLIVADKTETLENKKPKALDIHVVSKSFCECKKPQPNYPEMVWCDNCTKEIEDN